MNREEHDLIQLDRPVIKWMNINERDFIILKNRKVVQVVDTYFRNEAYLLNNSEDSWRYGGIKEILVCVHPFTPQEKVFVEKDDVFGVWINPSEVYKQNNK